MISASLYIIGCSARNRLRVRLRRLREPRYLLGAIAGAAYFYFTIFARIRGAREARTRRGVDSSPMPSASTLVEAGGLSVMGVALLLLAVLVWVFPAKSTLLEFSEAEVQFLFPAPVTRRQLLIYRMLRSQLALLFGAIISSLFLPTASIMPRLRMAAGVWILFVTIRLYFAGVTMARTRLASSTAGAARVARAPLMLLIAALATVVAPLVRLFLSSTEGTRALLAGMAEVLDRGAPKMVLLPFTTLARPMLTTGLGPFLVALAASAAVMAAMAAWVLTSDAAFQEAAVESSDRRAERKARGGSAPRVRATGLTLAPSGRAESIFFWKAATNMARNTGGTALFRYVVPLLILLVTMLASLMTGRNARGGAAALGMLSAAVAGFFVLLGPQIIRVDLRDDLRYLDVIKTWPVRAAAVIRGQMLWPGVLLTGFVWLAVVCAAIFSAAAFPRMTMAWRVSLTVTALLLAPALVFGQLTVHNATAVLFPAWVPLGNARPRGLDMMGQRLLLLAAVLITLAVFMLPGAIIGAILWFAFSRFIGAAVLIPGAAICLVIVVIEVLAITEALGPAFDRLDMTGVERPE